MKKEYKLRSQQWFDNPENPGMTALYLERYLNFGLTMDEFRLAVARLPDDSVLVEWWSAIIDTAAE